MKILVVEDEELLRALVVDAFEEAGFEVIEAGTGEEALARCREHQADALLTDIRLGGELDGWDIAEHCRSCDPNIPVVYATGFNTVAERRVPGSRFFRKPFRPEDLINAVRELLPKGGQV